MSRIEVQNVPEEVHQAARRRAEREGVTLSAYVLGLLQRDLAALSNEEWFARLDSRPPQEVALEVVSALHASREERDARLREALH